METSTKGPPWSSANAGTFGSTIDRTTTRTTTTPTDETWTAKYGECDPDDRGSIEIWHVEMGEFTHESVYLYDREDRARLASAAPEMARVLLAIEWSGGGDGDCPSCRGDRYYGTNAHPAGHAPDCALDAALRKAGVR